jgi:nucleoside phosphorylase
MSNNTSHFLIVTALKLEFNAVKAFLKNIKAVHHPETGTVYEVGEVSFGDSYKQVAIIETGAGNNRAADETNRGIAFFKPDYVFFVGIAGGIKDVNLGDVVAATKVIGYEGGKVEGHHKPRPDTITCSYELEQIARSVSRSNNWHTGLDSLTPDSIVGPIAAGEKVLAHDKSDVVARIKEYASDAIAVEMEGIGFLVAARPHKAQAIVIRGISDLIEGKAEADKGGSQPIAAKAAAAFAFAMIQLLLAGQISNHANTKYNLSELEGIKEMVDKLTELYPMGPLENNVWKRAGGDVSKLKTSLSGRTQWYDAVDLLSKGGGGKNLSIDSLIEVVKEEFPNSFGK